MVVFSRVLSMPLANPRPRDGPMRPSATKEKGRRSTDRDLRGQLYRNKSRGLRAHRKGELFVESPLRQYGVRTWTLFIARNNGNHHNTKASGRRASSSSERQRRGTQRSGHEVGMQPEHGSPQLRKERTSQSVPR
jgi:hypothetical protein